MEMSVPNLGKFAYRATHPLMSPRCHPSKRSASKPEPGPSFPACHILCELMYREPESEVSRVE